VIPAAVRYARAGTVEEALELLAEPDAKVLAGGQSLLPVLKLRIARPELLVDIGALELKAIEVRDGEASIGALATWDEIAGAESLGSPALAAIPECARAIGDLQVRNRGTIGGSLVHADPASDMPAVLLALGARLEVVSPAGTGSVDAVELFAGPYLTTLGPSDLVTAVVLPLPETGSGSAYVSVEHPASGFALAGAAALVGPDGTSRIAVTGIAATPLLLEDGFDSLDGVEVFGDRFAPEEYRRSLARVVVQRAVDRASARAQEAA
jgi:carbon-monoxide dehydrogenase medium subunit